LLDATLEAISARDGAALFQVIESVVDAGHDPRRFVSDLLERMRDVIVVQSVPDAAGSGLIDAPDDEVERIVQQAKVLGPAEASRTADVVSATLSELKGATAPRLRLEMMAARLLVPAADDSDDGSRARLEHLERVVAALPVSGGTGAAEPAVKPAEDKSAKQPSKKAESTAAKPNSEEEGSSSKAPAPPRISEVAPSTATESSVEATTSDVTLEGFVSMWPAVMDALAGYGRVPWMAFSGSRPLSWSDDTLAVGLDSPGKVANVANSGHGDAMQAAIKDVLKVEVRLDVVLASEATTSSSAGTTASTTPAKDADAPSLDDADVDDVTGVDLVMRELGGVQIGEIEH
jgi:DNA polymerase-3 subunit gamma/tau